MQPPPPSRRRRRASRAAGPPPTAGEVDPVADAAYLVVDASVLGVDGRSPAPVVPPSPPPADALRTTATPATPSDPAGRRRPTAPVEAGRPTRWAGARRGREEQGERALRLLVTHRGSQVSPTTALRAREVEVPSAEDLARAEAEVVVVRRNYVPSTALTPSRRTGRGRGEVDATDRRRPRGSDD